MSSTKDDAVGTMDDLILTRDDRRRVVYAILEVGGFLGLPGGESQGDSSMPSKRVWSEDAYGHGLQGPRDKVRAALPEPQPPAMQMYIPRHSV